MTGPAVTQHPERTPNGYLNPFQFTRGVATRQEYSMKLFLWLFGLLAWSFMALAQTFTNPVIFQDLADLMVIRVNTTYYYSASTMAYSPGAPILRSYDLVNWEFIGHSVPTLDFGDINAYSLIGGRAYVRGIWASFFNYRASTNTWYWGGCVDFNSTYIYTASAVTGPWTYRSTINTCYYDSSLLIDDDGSMYVSYGSTTLNVAKLSSDGLSQVSTQAVYTSPSSIGYIEGSRFYKRDGKYYIFTTHPADSEYVLMSSSGPFGPYTIKPLVQSVVPPISGAGNPHQGGMVCTPSDVCYYMAFIDSYPEGRAPVLAPLTWGSDGFPAVTLVNDQWGQTYNYPLAQHTVTSQWGTDHFNGTSLRPEWEWNHNPDTTKFRVNNALFLDTATVTYDIYSARNTLTHRIPGPASRATISIDPSGMVDGDRSGLALFRDSSAWIGIARNNSVCSIWYVNNITMDSSWNTATTGTLVQSQSVSCSSTAYFRIVANIAPSADHTGHFYYSTDGSNFVSFGQTFTMITAWQYFIGYRFGIFHYGTLATGGTIKVNYFDLQAA